VTSHIAAIRFDRQQLPNRDRAHLCFSLVVSFCLVFCSSAVIRAADVKISSENDLLKRQQALPLAPRPEMVDVQHFKISYDKKYYCGHPRQTVFKNFGDGEIVIGHNRGTTTRGGKMYEVPKDVSHGYWNGGYVSRGVVLLQRSTDGASTWWPPSLPFRRSDSKSIAGRRPAGAVWPVPDNRRPTHPAHQRVGRPLARPRATSAARRDWQSIAPLSSSGLCGWFPSSLRIRFTCFRSKTRDAGRSEHPLRPGHRQQASDGRAMCQGRDEGRILNVGFSR